MNWPLLGLIILIEIVFGAVCFFFGAMAMRNYIESLPKGIATVEANRCHEHPGGHMRGSPACDLAREREHRGA